jgi:outer membrane lipoprotein SlyB
MTMKKIFTLVLALVLLSVAANRSLAQGRDRRTYYDNQSRSSRVYYDRRYRDRSFWDKHRDKVTVGAGTAGGAIIGGLIGGKKGAIIGALAGAGGSALYTYKIRDRRHRW